MKREHGIVAGGLQDSLVQVDQALDIVAGHFVPNSQVQRQTSRDAPLVLQEVILIPPAVIVHLLAARQWPVEARGLCNIRDKRVQRRIPKQPANSWECEAFDVLSANVETGLEHMIRCTWVKVSCS